MQFTWLGAAGFRIETDEGAIILIDPFLSRPAQATPDLPIQTSDLFPIDEILLTHGCFDHASDTPELVQQTGAIVHAPAILCERLQGLGISPNSLEPVRLKKKKRIGSLTWQALPGQFHQVRTTPSLQLLKENQPAFNRLEQLEQKWPLGEVVSYLFQTERLHIAHFGSAGWTESDIEALKVDVALLPVENPPMAEAVVIQLIHHLQPRLVIPHHWDNYFPPLTRTIDLSSLQLIIQNHSPRTRVYQPTIGQTFNLNELI